MLPRLSDSGRADLVCCLNAALTEVEVSPLGGMGTHTASAQLAASQSAPLAFTFVLLLDPLCLAGELPQLTLKLDRPSFVGARGLVVSG